ncbi:MAG: ABC transporter permease [Pirellulales bacterium]|nr:ABC transporter permease [Pirellulales bacterium]
MISFLAKRFLWMMVTLWVVFTASFFLMRAVPGGPFDSERNLPPEIEANMMRRYHLDDSLWNQYWRQLSNTIQGDLGDCYRRDLPVDRYIREGLPVSAALGLLALVFSMVLGITAGIISAVHRGSVSDLALRSVATVGIALPNFVVAGLAIIGFVFLFPVFPAAGWGSVRQLILPAFCLGAPYAAYVARIMRTSMLDVLSQDYIRTARAKGLTKRQVVLRHALPGALLPIMSFLGPATAGILTGSLVIERIFYIPGLGSHFVQAALDRDYTLAMGLVLLYTVLLYTMNVLVDISYALLDPRIELE